MFAVKQYAVLRCTSFSFVLSLVLCHLINLVQLKFTVFIKSTAVYTNVLDLHIYSPFTHPERLPALQTPFMVSAPYRLPHLSSIPYFYC